MADKIARIVYRNNDLFEMLVPKVIEILEGKGYEIRLVVVPKGTDDWETKQIARRWYNQERLATGYKPIEVISDNTCASSVGNEVGGQLDHVASLGVVAAFLGVNRVTDYLHERRSSLEETKKIFQESIRAVGERVGNPVVVRIKTDNLTDHEPFVTYERNPWREVRMPADEAVGHLQSWVREIFPNCKFDCEKDSTQATWYIVDRHARQSGGYVEAKYLADSGEGHSLLQFRLPVESMVFDLANLGLLASVDKLTEQMVEALVSYFSRY